MRETIRYLRKLNNNNDAAAGFPTIGTIGDIHDNKTQLVQLAYVAGFMILCCLLIGWALYRCNTDPIWRNHLQYGLQDPSSAASYSANNRMELKQRQAYVAKALVVKHVIREETSSSPSTSSNKKNPYQHHPRHAKMIPKGEDIVLSEDDIKDLDNTSKGIQHPWMCAICLTAYRIGDEICWSQNDDNDCRHVYHYDCIQQWLWKQDHCPCCRLTFLHFGNQDNDDDNDNENEQDHVENHPSTITAVSTAHETSSNGAINPNDHNHSATITVTTLSTDVATGKTGERVHQDEESGNPSEQATTPTPTPTTATLTVDAGNMAVKLSFPTIDDNDVAGRKVAALDDLENPMQIIQPDESIRNETPCWRESQQWYRLNTSPSDCTPTLARTSQEEKIGQEKVNASRYC